LRNRIDIVNCLAAPHAVEVTCYHQFMGGMIIIAATATKATAEEKEEHPR
jgi:hypothetical protein